LEKLPPMARFVALLCAIFVEFRGNPAFFSKMLQKSQDIPSKHAVSVYSLRSGFRPQIAS